MLVALPLSLPVRLPPLLLRCGGLRLLPLLLPLRTLGPLMVLSRGPSWSNLPPGADL
jgi:hypothetical protein